MKFLSIHGRELGYYPLSDLAKLGDLSTLPYSLKVLLENLYRQLDGIRVKESDLKALIHSQSKDAMPTEIPFVPARVLMQDFTGVPAVVDLAAMRDAMTKKGNLPGKINPLVPVDLVIDHSVMVDRFSSPEAFEENVRFEYERNLERYTFLKWGQEAFDNFRVVPPGTGICHQVNLEYLAGVVWSKRLDETTEVIYPDTVVGTDSHTTMINGLSVLGWGVGGIEAEAAMLGQPISMLIPEVIGVKLVGQLSAGATATDLVLTITQVLRKRGVVGKFVEFYGPGLSHLSLADRATIANMAPEYGATCGFFPIDDETLAYLHLTGRPQDHIDVVEMYAKTQGLWRNDKIDPKFKDTLTVDLSSVTTALAGPKRPQDRVLLEDLSRTALDITPVGEARPVEGAPYKIKNHDVMIAAITSCTNTSNPSVMIAAGLVARKARALGLTRQPWVKTSLAPGSQVVTDYLNNGGLMEDLEALGFYLVGYGCTTCIGNSGPLAQNLVNAIEKHDLQVVGVLSGNRNFEGRINPYVKLNYLASPPLVVAYAIAGTTALDLTKEPLGISTDGKPVYLKDIWPSRDEIQEMMTRVLKRETFQERYRDVFKGDAHWQEIPSHTSQTYTWVENSTYVKNPPYFEAQMVRQITDIENGRILALLGDSITTDHISPAGSIKKDGPAGIYLIENGVGPESFNSYGARRGNHEIMMRGTFANIRLQNEMVPGITGGMTRYLNGEDTQTSIYEAAMRYAESDTPLIIVAGKEYGTGSSRDWAAKGTRLLGVRAVIAESFERIHRSNLVGMGVFPLEFTNGQTRKTLGLDGTEHVQIQGLSGDIKPRMPVQATFKSADGRVQKVELLCRVDTLDEVSYMASGGILPFVLEQLSA